MPGENNSTYLQEGLHPHGRPHFDELPAVCVTAPAGNIALPNFLQSCASHSPLLHRGLLRLSYIKSIIFAENESL